MTRQTPAHLVPTVTDRGFRWMPSIEGVEIYESSVASEPKIWLKISVLPSTLMGAHLTLDQAAKLRDQLDWLIRHHYQASDEKGSHG